MNEGFLINNKILLRAVEPEDLDLMYQMENDPESWNISNFTVPYSRAMLREYIKSTQYDIFADKQLRLIIVLREGQKSIGTVDLTDYSPLHNRAEIGIGLMKCYRGYGYASQALELLEEYAFKFLHLHQLMARVEVGNDSCVRLFQSRDYLQTAQLTDWLCRGDVYKNVIIFQKIYK